MATKKPWEGKLFPSDGRRSSRTKTNDRMSLIFSTLMILFVIIVVLVIGFSIYLSIGGSKNAGPGEAFFNPGVDQIATTPEPAAEEEEVTEAEPVITEATEAPAWSGATMAVNAGEGAGAIAARAGISIERLYELNPEYLQTGAWYANPGDIVRVD